MKPLTSVDSFEEVEVSMELSREQGLKLGCLLCSQQNIVSMELSREQGLKLKVWGPC